MSAVLDAVQPTADEEDSARLSLKAAIDAYTSGPAWASFDEQRKGTIAPGMLADLVVLSDDIFKAAAAEAARERASRSRSSTARSSTAAASATATDVAR